MIDIRRYRFIVIYTLLCLIVAAFIFSNSAQGSQESNEVSLSLSNRILEVIDSFVEIDEDAFHKIIRKTAHFIEFAVLGITISLLLLSVKKISKRYHISMGVLLVLITAVVDEFIQSFTGRTSSVSDVILDFSGAVCGIALVFLVEYLQEKRKA